MSPAFQDVLLIEDEAELARTLTFGLKKIGLAVRHAQTLQEARLLIEESEPDFILLDRQLPDGDGLSLCHELRKQNYNGSILMLTARCETIDRVQGLKAGADDYLTKPFSWDELLARIEALSRRGAIRKPESESTGALWKIDESRLRIKGPLGWKELTPLEFKLATHLIRAEGSIVSREDLLQKVWGFTLLPKTRTVDHFMGRIRKSFELDPENPIHFLTVRGAGYRFLLH